MRKYEPEILMGLIMSLALLLAFPPRGAAAPERPSASHAAVQIDPEAQKASFDRTHSVRLLQGDAVGTISMREYLIGVVLSEMPMSFEPEALRAQAIASRTYVLHSSRHSDADVCDDGACCQCREDEESLRRRFGADYEAVREKAQQAVDSTDGIVLTYGGALIDATYFSCSGGMTEDAREVWGPGGMGGEAGAHRRRRRADPRDRRNGFERRAAPRGFWTPLHEFQSALGRRTLLLRRLRRGASGGAESVRGPGNGSGGGHGGADFDNILHRGGNLAHINAVSGQYFYSTRYLTFRP